MANPIFTDGFEQFDNSNPLPSAFLQAGYTASSDIAVGRGRIPGGVSVITGESPLIRDYKITGSRVSVGFALQFPARGRFLQVEGIVSAELNPENGLILMGGQTGQVIPAKDRWYYFEIDIDWSTQQAELFVNGKRDIQASIGGSAPSQIRVNLGGKSGSGDTVQSVRYLFDDLYINDGARIGPIEITTQIADHNENQQDWNTSQVDDNGNDVSHVDMVGVTPPQPIDNYVQSDRVGARDMYSSSIKLARSAAVKAVAIVALARVTRRTANRLELRHDTNVALAEELGTSYRYTYTQMPFPAGTDGNTEAAKLLSINVGAAS